MAVEIFHHSGREIRRDGDRHALGQVGSAFAETECRDCRQTVRVDASTVEQATALLLTHGMVAHLRSHPTR